MAVPSNNPRARGWCITRYPQDQTMDGVNALFKELVEHLTTVDHLTRVIFQLEKAPDTGRLHFQGYIEFENPRTRKAAQAAFLSTNCFAATRKGTPFQAWDYCAKSESVVEPLVRFTLGTPPVPAKPGKRNDLERYCAMIIDGRSVSDIIYHNPSALRVERYLNRWRAVYMKKNRKKVWDPRTVHVFHGPTGMGKTQQAYHLDPQLYSVPCTQQGKTVWFDNYDGEHTILFDDFAPSMISRQLFLQITDAYPMQLQVKGGFVPREAKRLIFTSNFHPDTWYYDAMGLPDPAVRRRMTEVKHVTERFVAPGELLFPPVVPPRFITIMSDESDAAADEAELTADDIDEQDVPMTPIPANQQALGILVSDSEEEDLEWVSTQSQEHYLENLAW